MGSSAFKHLRRAATGLGLLALTLSQAGCATVSVNEPLMPSRPDAARSWDPDREAVAARERAERHRTFLSEGVPVEYVSRTNPWPPTRAEIEAGGRLYAANCAGCHDPAGTGHGAEGRALDLPPAVIAAMVDQPHSIDQYMLWSIAEGGLRSGSQMPAFKSRLTDRQIWQIVHYMRAGFPPVEGEAG